MDPQIGSIHEILVFVEMHKVTLLLFPVLDSGDFCHLLIIFANSLDRTSVLNWIQTV